MKANELYFKGDERYKALLSQILEEGCLDENPRPKYSDGTPAHTLSINHVMESYDLSKGELPLTTLRPIAVKSAIAEILWIYQEQSSDLVVFDRLLGKDTWDKDYKINNWWEEWALRDKEGNYLLNETGHPYIGQCYGATVKAHNLMDNLIRGIKENPDGRRHIMNMWQEEDFKKPHGLKPCAYQTVWNVRHSQDGNDYLDMCLFQRSSDYVTAGIINQFQYIALQKMVCLLTGYKPGKFSWFVANIQIYDRHIDAVKELLKRDYIPCNPKFEIVPVTRNEEKLLPADFILEGYPLADIKEKNPQVKLDLGI